MVSKAFDINTGNIEPFEAEEKMLLVEWHPSQMQVILWDKPSKKPQALESFTGGLTMAKDLDHIKGQSKLLVLNQLEITLLSAGKRAMLVPAAEGQPASAKNEINLFYGDADKQVDAAFPIPVYDALLYWQWPVAVQQWFSQTFPVVHWSHILSVVLEEVQNRPNMSGELIIYPEFAWLVLGSKAGLKYAWTLPFEGPQDLAWQVLNVCQQLDIPEPSVKWQVHGMVSADSALFKGFTRFFHQLSNGQELGQWTDEIPPYYTSHLLYNRS